MKKYVLILAITLLLISSLPIFIFVREIWTEKNLQRHYDIKELYAYGELKVPLQWNDHTINIVEKVTGKKAERTIHDEFDNVAAGDIVELQMVVDDQIVLQGNEVALSNRTVNPRYWSWLAIVEVINKQSQQKQLAIIQRDYKEGNELNGREWHVVWVNADGTTDVVHFPYKDRSQYVLETKLIQMTGTTPMSMGYYSDIMHYYPTLFFPVLYPFGSALLGGILLIISFIIYGAAFIVKNRRKV